MVVAPLLFSSPESTGSCCPLDPFLAWFLRVSRRVWFTCFMHFVGGTGTDDHTSGGRTASGAMSVYELLLEIIKSEQPLV